MRVISVRGMHVLVHKKKLWFNNFISLLLMAMIGQLIKTIA